MAMRTRVGACSYRAGAFPHGTRHSATAQPPLGLHTHAAPCTVMPAVLRVARWMCRAPLALLLMLLLLEAVRDDVGALGQPARTSAGTVAAGAGSTGNYTLTTPSPARATRSMAVSPVPAPPGSTLSVNDCAASCYTKCRVYAGEADWGARCAVNVTASAVCSDKFRVGNRYFSYVACSTTVTTTAPPHDSPTSSNTPGGTQATEPARVVNPLEPLQCFKDPFMDTQYVAFLLHRARAAVCVCRACLALNTASQTAICVHVHVLAHAHLPHIHMKL